MASKKKPHRKNIKIKGKRHCDQDIANAMLYYVVGQKVFPICRSEPASHGAGVALGVFAVQAMLDRVDFIRDCIGSRIADLKGEDDYCHNKLIEHLRILSGLQRLLAVTLDEKDAEISNSRYVNTATSNILSRIFRLFNKDDILRKGLTEMAEVLDKHLEAQFTAHMNITEEILDLTPAIREKVSSGEVSEPDYSEMIKPLLTGKLQPLKKKADKLIKILKAMRYNLIKDWQANMNQIKHKKVDCRALQKRHFKP